MHVFAGFCGRYTKEDFDGEMVAANERFAAGTVKRCFLCVVGNKKVVELEVDRGALAAGVGVNVGAESPRKFVVWADG
eukprot:7231952-Ditylum_brightwellii.AAC.1